MQHLQTQQKKARLHHCTSHDYLSDVQRLMQVNRKGYYALCVADGGKIV